MASTKEDRLQIRADAGAKRLLESAAKVRHTNVSAFVMAAALSEAESVLAERQRIELSHDVFDAFEEALTRPARVNERLAETLGRARTFSWVD